MALKKNCTTLAKVRDDEDIFVLRGQDITAPRMIVRWIEFNIFTAPDEKLREAFECALRMRHQGTKMPD